MPTATTIDVQKVIEKMTAMRDALDKKIVDRREQLLGVQIALVSKSHIILHGNPGNAKSMTVNGLLTYLPDVHLFATQAFKASTPEQFLGPISMKGLEEDEFRRIVANRFADCHVAFIDELPRAPRAILPAFQGGMVERTFDNGNGPEPIPLMTMIGTSNHLPDDDELQAFFDRFTWRYVVEAPQSQDSFKEILRGGVERRLSGGNVTPPDPEECVSLDELVTLQDHAASVTVPDEIYDTIGEIWSNLTGIGVQPSIRRYNDLVGGLQAAAALRGDDTVRADDVLLGQHSLWTSETERAEVYGEIVKHASEWEKEKAALLDGFTESRAKLIEIQTAVAGNPSSMADVRNEALDVVADFKKFEDAARKHVGAATGQDVSGLERALHEVEVGREWVGDKLMGGIRV